jgi:p-hydroxybenzoate 3-monooxygenase
MRTQVGIVGAGPAGLLLSHLLHLAGIESVIVETRSRAAIEETIRAGVLEQGTVDLMTETGVGERMHREGALHGGFDFRFNGQSHRIDLHGLTGRSIMVYAQHEVLKDLIAARLAAGGQIHFSATNTSVHDVTSQRPRIQFVDSAGVAQQVECDILAGCDGSYGICRKAIPADLRRDYLRIYPFGWFGILCKAPPSHHELIYARSDRGFALISTRNQTVQRMYFQCDPATNANDWSSDRIWEELQARVAGDGFQLQEGEIFQKGVIPMRSFVCEPMQYGRMFLAGDAGHSVPPTGAKGLNLAANDVVIMACAIEAFTKTNDDVLLQSYSATALKRVWLAQHFSWWMTSMLHNGADGNMFDARRQIAELELVTSNVNAARTLAQIYVGAPLGS